MRYAFAEIEIIPSSCISNWSTRSHRDVLGGLRDRIAHVTHPRGDCHKRRLAAFFSGLGDGRASSCSERFRLVVSVFEVPDTDHLVHLTIPPPSSLAMSAARLLTRAVRPSAFARQPVRFKHP